jgi:hypothetical protein
MQSRPAPHFRRQQVARELFQLRQFAVRRALTIFHLISPEPATPNPGYCGKFNGL